MAARPLVNMGNAKITSTCHTKRLKNASFNSSHHCERGMLSGTFMSRRASHNTGKPVSIDKLRNVSGGKPVTPIFMTGQLMPQTTVSKARTVHWRVESLCMAGILARAFKIGA